LGAFLFAFVCVVGSMLAVLIRMTIKYRRSRTVEKPYPIGGNTPRLYMTYIV
jgi:hypothetical protein